MNEFEIRRALEILKVTRLHLIRNNLNNDELEARYKELIDLLMNRLTILEVKSSWNKVH